MNPNCSKFTLGIFLLVFFTWAATASLVADETPLHPEGSGEVEIEEGAPPLSKELDEEEFLRVWDEISNKGPKYTVAVAESEDKETPAAEDEGDEDWRRRGATEDEVGQDKNSVLSPTEKNLSDNDTVDRSTNQFGPFPWMVHAQKNVKKDAEEGGAVARPGRKASYAVLQRWHYRLQQERERVTTKVAKTPHQVATKVSSEKVGSTTVLEFPEVIHRAVWCPRPPCAPHPGGRTRLRIGHRYPDSFKSWHGLAHGCGCDERGSIGKACDIRTGQCPCRNNVVGRTCSSCKLGYWGISMSGDCRRCACNPVGTQEGQCEDSTGHCRCRPGVGGPECDRCKPGFWGFSNAGCKPCEPCDFPGRNCDPASGRCVCPPHTEGDKCERCSQGFWDYSADIGCRPCSCSGPGSLERQCDARTGRCVCRHGYEGDRCHECSYGSYGYPHCRPCGCDPAGTDPRMCRGEGHCQCDGDGRCPCKPNVRGITCDQCAKGTFGLSASNHLGCFQCFCFKKSARCRQADLTWSQLALPGERHLELSTEETRLNITNQHFVIPDTGGDVKIGTSLPFSSPLYWQMPKEFMRDKIRSYNGVLRFRVQMEGHTRTYPKEILQSYPLVSLQGNWQIVLEYYPRNIAVDGRYQVRLHEDLWRLKSSPQKVTREQFMIALQNVQHILIRATHSSDFTSAMLSEVSLEIATEGTPVSSRRALGVEQCFCPKGYSGTSCQNPSVGFYRWYKENHIQSTIIIDLVGESKPCECNGRADVCDQETGVCQNCRENTAGPHCDECATGYYGDPDKGRCKPCACPSRQQNFASTCKADPYSEYVCHCRRGYTGRKCERCAQGYYGKPAELGGSCQPCKCDPNGSVGPGCDSQGNCRCYPGITGKDCSQCAPRHIVAETGCISCEDGCVNVLLDEVEQMIKQVTSVQLDGNRIPLPWPTLDRIRNETRSLSSQLDRYESRVGMSQELLLNFELDTIARVILHRVEQLNEKAHENLPSAVRVRKEADDILKSLTRLKVILEESVHYLENYGIGETPSVSIIAALDEAERILRQMKRRNFDELGQRAKTELMRSQELLGRVRLMDQSGSTVNKLFDRFHDVDLRVNDLVKRIRESQRTVTEAKALDAALRRRIGRIRTHLDDIGVLHLYTKDHNFNASRMVRKAERNLENTYRNFDLIVEMMEDLTNKSATLSEFEAALWQLNNAYKDNYVKKAEDHALHLEAQAIKLEELFSKTRDVADGPLRAAEAYQRIVDALLAAEEAARNASEAAVKAYKVAYPGDPDDSLVRRSKQTLEASEALRAKGDGLQGRVEQLSAELHKQRRALESTAEVVADSNARLDLAHNQLDTQFSSEISEEIKRALDKGDETERSIDRTLSLVQSIHHNLTEIRSYTKEISDLDSSLFQGISDTITDIEGMTMKGERMSVNLLRQSTRIELRGQNIREKIEALKRRIEQTRQYASSIRVSLTTDENGVCIRKYRPFLQPSTTSRITLGYAINSAHRDALLLFMSSSNASDFMAVEMVDRKIHFTWDSGGGRKTIVHPLPLETNNPLASDESRWYHITINRIGNIGELSVRPAFIKNSSRKKLYEPVTGATPAGFSRMDLHPWDYTWIGGLPEQAETFLKVNHFKGCLHYVTIDGEPLGLWNFTESIGCGACNEGFELQVEAEDKTAFGFNGKGYFKGYNRIRRPKPFYSVVLSFRSLDEDALLFLSYNVEQNQYLSIGLKDGRVTFTVQFDLQTQLVMKSEKKLNNMRELIQIQADVQISLKNGIRMGKLVVGDQNQLATIKGGPDLNLSHEPFYFGGVDPEFNRDVIGKQIELRSLLGCMGGLSVLEVGKNPHHDGQSYGIDKTCPREIHSDIGFLGQGYLEMPSRVLRRESNFGFTFKTMESDAILMLSTFVGQDEEELTGTTFTTTTTTTTTTTLPPTRGGLPNPPDYYSVSLVEGHLDLRLYSGSQRHRVMSRDRYNDGKLHSFFVLKEHRKVRLFVDDEVVNSTRLDRGSHVVEAPSEGGLFFGGVPPEISIGGMAGSSQALKGCIQDVIINNMLLPFNEPIRFENAFIGRCADLPRNAMGGMESDMKHVMECRPPKQHTVEYGALKFGDQIESHVVIPIEKNTFKTDFEVSFEFRTYYPSGLFFIAFNEKTNRRGRKKLNLISTQLQNGRLQIVIKNNRKEKKIISPIAGLNSGEWKKVVLQKTRRKLRVVMDGSVVNKEKMRKRNRFGSKLFIGSLPRTLASGSDIAVQEPFRGCFRNLVINGEKFEIPSLTRQDHIVGVGQCFASVQPGSYFPGDAFALYDDNFQVGPLLELRLEFRTWELNGVLLSVADPKTDIALSLELDNGAVLFAVNVGHNRPFSARVTLPNIFALCDNQWHTVKAHYIKDSLTLRVDSHPEAYGFNGSNNLKKTLTEAPLYIGGIPDSASSGTLTGRENFKGCIRNIVLNSERKDWTDMYKLHHVLLNACPIL